jgi:hypothetical protein
MQLDIKREGEEEKRVYYLKKNLKKDLSYRFICLFASI